MDRAATGVDGLDKLIEGGFPINSSVVISGTPGTGKSIFALNFLVSGAMKNEPGVYVSLEDSAQNLRDQAAQFGWNLEGLEKSGKIKILEVPLNVADVNLIETLIKNISSVKAKRMVIDSLSVLIFNAHRYKLPVGKTSKIKDIVFQNSGEISMGTTTITEGTQFIYNVIAQIKEMDVTTLLLTDSTPDGNTKDGISEFISDGVIKFGLKDFGKTWVRTAEISKMRRTNLQPGLKTLEINGTGLHIHDFTY